MDFKATIGRVNESWRKLAPTLDKAALKHIGDKEDKNGILLGCFTASYYKRSHLIQGSEVLYAYVFKAFRQDQDESEIRYPTWLLFSPSKEFEADPNLYKPIADQLLALPLSQPKERDLKKLSYAISDNFADAAYLELPPSLTGGKLVYLSIIYCRSNTMPYFHLGLNLILANRAISKEVLYLPSEYWDKDWNVFYQGSGIKAN
jgi:hypothetical protein